MTAITKSIVFIQTTIKSIHEALSIVANIQCKTTKQRLLALDLKAMTSVIDALCRNNDIEYKPEYVQIAFKNLQSILVVIHATLTVVNDVSEEHKQKYLYRWRSLDYSEYLDNLVLNTERLNKRFTLFATLYQ